MDRRNFAKTVVSLPVLPSISIPDVEDTEDDRTALRAVWKRRTDDGFAVDGNGETEFEAYEDWRRYVASQSSDYDICTVASLYDFELVSMRIDNDRWRTHWAHPESGLEVTYLRDTTEDVEYEAYIRAVDESFREGRHYASTSQIMLAEKIRREKEYYL